MEFKKPLTKLLIYVRTKALEAVDVVASAMQSNAGCDIKKELGKGFFEFHRVYSKEFKIPFVIVLACSRSKALEAGDAIASSMQSNAAYGVSQSNDKRFFEFHRVYIKKTFGITYSHSSVICLLHQLGFVYKKPKLIPGKASADNQKQFLSELKQEEQNMGEHNTPQSCVVLIRRPEVAFIWTRCSDMYYNRDKRYFEINRV